MKKVITVIMRRGFPLMFLFVLRREKNEFLDWMLPFVTINE